MRFDELFGQEDFSTGAQQATQLAGYFEQVHLCATQVWDRLTLPSGSEDPASSLLCFNQKLEELLSNFILRTRTSLERNIPKPTPRNLLLKPVYGKA